MSEPKINFDEKTHQYSVNGKKLISTTQLLKKYGLSANYGGIPKHILEKAATKGKAVHNALEQYIQGNQGVVGLFDEVELFDNYVQARKIDMTTMKSEEMVVDLHYGVAGTIDVQYEDNGPVLADFKNTSTLHVDVVAWQLSIYNYLKVKGDLVQYYFKQLKVIHFTKGRMYVKDIYTVEYDAVVALFEAHLNNQSSYTYVRPSKVVTQSEDVYVSRLLNEIQLHKASLKNLEQELKSKLSVIKDGFEKQKEYSYRKGTLSIKYSEPSVKRSLNQGKAKEFITKHGGDLEDFMTVVVTPAKVVANIVKPTAPSKPKKKNP